jgi:hypothetical protein
VAVNRAEEMMIEITRDELDYKDEGSVLKEAHALAEKSGQVVMVNRVRSYPGFSYGHWLGKQRHLAVHPSGVTTSWEESPYKAEKELARRLEIQAKYN